MRCHPLSLGLVALLGLSACAAPPPEPTPAPAPPPVAVVATAQPVLPPPPPVTTSAVPAPDVDPVVTTVSDGTLVDLDDDSDVIGLDTDTAQPLPPRRRPDCVPSLEASGDPNCQAPEPVLDGSLEVDTTVGVEPLDGSDTGD